MPASNSSGNPIPRQRALELIIPQLSPQLGKERRGDEGVSVPLFLGLVLAVQPRHCCLPVTWGEEEEGDF